LRRYFFIQKIYIAVILEQYNKMAAERLELHRAQRQESLALSFAAIARDKGGRKKVQKNDVVQVLKNVSGGGTGGGRAERATQFSRPRGGVRGSPPDNPPIARIHRGRTPRSDSVLGSLRPRAFECGSGEGGAGAGASPTTTAEGRPMPGAGGAIDPFLH
jgi:hypothetical protein